MPIGLDKINISVAGM